MSEMVERVAKTLHAAIGYEHWPHPKCTQCFDAARKIIEAMREPDELMRTVGDTTISAPGHHGPFGAGVIWRAMIDAALKD